MNLDQRAHGERRERMRASPRFDGSVFQNTRPTSMGLEPGQKLPVFKELFRSRSTRRPPAPLPSVDPRPAWARAPESGFRATWLGHSTVLLEMDGVRVLTDPVWSERISPFGIMAPKRFQAVPATIADLPPLDAILISHDHFDHLDHGSVRQLAPLGVPFVTALGVGKYLQAWGVPATQIIELDWWQQAKLKGGDLVFTATPSQHFSGRVGGRNATLWASWVIQGRGRKVFFSGDTGLTPEFEEIRAKAGPFDLVMLEVGAFHEAWGKIHLGPKNALAALRMLGGGRFLPVHWGTFNLGLHPWDEPAEQLLQLVAAQRDVDLVMPPLGAAFEPTREHVVTPWWRDASVPAPADHPLIVAG